jgi:hypothetical protein
MEGAPAIFDTIRQHKQDHLIEHYHSLSDPVKREQFLKQLESVNYEQAAQLYQHVYLDKAALKDHQKNEFSPVHNIATHEDLKTQAAQFDQLGYMAIAKR